MKTYWRPISNNQRKFKGHTRHFNQVCPYCSSKTKQINLHYKTYHPKELKEYENVLSRLFAKGEFGSVNGVRFIKTG